MIAMQHLMYSKRRLLTRPDLRIYRCQPRKSFASSVRSPTHRIDFRR
jgi:hypothetical protein